MPTNLNALIRYREIDKELRNPYTRTTIRRLQEVCSKQLEEFRGIYKLVSERTIRDDIRVLRSDALGFNAPIIVHGGIYSYETPNFSIYDGYVRDLELLKDITRLLTEEKDNIKNPSLEKILSRLLEITAAIPEKSISDSGEMASVAEKKVHRPSCLSLDALSAKNELSYSESSYEDKDGAIKKSPIILKTKTKETVIIPRGKVLWNLILEVL